MRAAIVLLGASLTLTAGCSCAPTPVGSDAGPVDAGFDAGVDAGFDAGTVDAGEVDAGPPPELQILKVLPPRGSSAGGTSVLISGSAFIRDFATRGSEAKAQTQLKFGSNPVLDVQIIDDETIEIRTPPGKSGLTNVSIENPNGLFVCTGCFTYFDDLYLTSVTPKEGSIFGGNEVTITGAGFTPDVHVLFGNVSSPQVTMVSSTELKVVAPPGVGADAVDVAVYNKNGLGTQRRVYTYVDATRVTQVTPRTGPVAGGTSVVVTGTGFNGASSVKFGGVEATSFTVNSPTQLTAVSPAAASAGAVDLTITTPRESWTATGAFTYADSAGAFAVYGVAPHLGAAAGGEVVTVTGQGLGAGGLTVSFGVSPATIVSQSATEVRVQVPPRGAGARKVDVTVTAGAQSDTLSNGFTYRLELTSLTPNTGPASGGTTVSLSGKNLPADAEVFVGALKGTVLGTPSDTAAAVTTPRGSGGAEVNVRVREAADPENEAVLPSAFTFQEALAIGRVQPERGAIAGGTIITVLGAGFADGTVVDFGPNRAKDIKVVDSHTLTCRAPKGEVGTVDVKVGKLTETDTLPGGYSYFHPRSISGGLSGGPLVGTLNISVLDSTQGFYGLPVPLANVMLGLDVATPFQGVTDHRGQLTFSDPALVKAQTVTVYKEGYESTTVTSVNAENLTVFVARTGGDGNPSPPPPGPPASLISGRVTGFKAPRPLTPNESLEARVFLAQSSFYEGPPFRAPFNRASEKWVITADNGEYLLFSGAGLRAAYAVLGVRNAQTGEFAPYLMGIKRGITTSPDNPAVGQDIVLDMHLDMTVPVTIDSPIQMGDADAGTLGPATNSTYAWMDLGAEGFIPNPNNWNAGTASRSSVSGTQAQLTFGGFPRLDGSNFIFLNEATGPTFYPVSYYYRRQPGDLSQGVTIGPLLTTPRFLAPNQNDGFLNTISWTADPGPAPDIHQVQILKPTLTGTVVLWSMVLPGTETQVVLPAPAVQKLKSEEAGNALFVALFSSRSPKFNYAQWTYDTLSGVSWSSYTIAVSDNFVIVP